MLFNIFAFVSHTSVEALVVYCRSSLRLAHTIGKFSKAIALNDEDLHYLFLLMTQVLREFYNNLQISTRIISHRSDLY